VESDKTVVRGPWYDCSEVQFSC